MGTEMVDIKAQLAAELQNLDKTVAAPSGHRISLKGKVFTFPDGKVSPGPIDAVVLDWRNVNQYYPGVYNANKLESPSCFALSKEIEGMAPDATCGDPQFKNCAECPMNDWGSAPGGGRGKACKNGVRIAIVPPDANKDTPVYTIDLGPTSLTAFNNMTNALSSQLGILPLQAKVQLDFDPNQSYPKIGFSELVPLDDDLIPTMFELRNAGQVLLDKLPGS